MILKNGIFFANMLLIYAKITYLNPEDCAAILLSSNCNLFILKSLWEWRDEFRTFDWASFHYFVNPLNQ